MILININIYFQDGLNGIIPNPFSESNVLCSLFVIGAEPSLV